MNNLSKDDEKLLTLFQCDYNRTVEQDFSQMLTENESINLAFINENQAFTDGRNIVVDPAMDGIFADKDALRNTERFMKLDNSISSDAWLALRMVTRGQNIHECLHIIYSHFPLYSPSDERATTPARLKVLCHLANIIEDAFIEAAGCSVYNNMELYLKFGRVSRLYANTPSDSTAECVFSKYITEKGKSLPLLEFLEYMCTMLLYPMVKQRKPQIDIAEYVMKTKKLFYDGAACGEPFERHVYTQKIFDIIEPLIPEDSEFDDEMLCTMIGETKTHSPQKTSVLEIASEGRSVTVDRLLFTDKDGEILDDKDFSEQLSELIILIEAQKNAAMKLLLTAGRSEAYTGADFKCAPIHRRINVKVEYPKVNLNMKKAYSNIHQRYRVTISSYNTRFTQLLKGKIASRDEKKLFGSGIASKRLSDTKKRYWYRNATDIDVPDIAVMLLIDGSGSMFGERRESAMISSVILHEVLKKQGIEHCVVEHRAIYGEPLVRHNILFDFNAPDEQKYNLLLLDANEGTREGLSLFWAEKYINEHSFAESKLIIVLSDGVPAHSADNDDEYIPPVSVKDTANAVTKIVNRGTQIIAVALDDNTEYKCYDALKEIYPSIVSCDNLKRLTGQLLTMISRVIE